MHATSKTTIYGNILREVEKCFGTFSLYQRIIWKAILYSWSLFVDCVLGKIIEFPANFSFSI